MTNIAFIGTGKMGGGMAARLIGAGHRLAVWNRSGDKTAPLVAMGARQAATPADAAKGVAAIFSMVADDAAAESIWFGPTGAMDVAAPGTLIIECSTLSVPQVKRLAAEAEWRGLAYIDCPVTGIPTAAAAGQLTLLVGAAPEVLERARPLLTPISKVIRHFGAVGSGSSFKLINNLLGAVHIAALAEAVALADKLGLDMETVIGALENGAVASPQVVRHCRPMATATYADVPSFTVGLRHKDASYCMAQASAAGIAMPIGAAATAHFAKAKETIFDADEARVIDAVRVS